MWDPWGVENVGRLCLGDDVDVSENSGTPKSSSFIGFSIINHPFWGTPIFGNTDVKNVGRMGFWGWMFFSPATYTS